MQRVDEEVLPLQELPRTLVLEVKDWPRIREARKKDRIKLLARVVTKISQSL